MHLVLALALTGNKLLRTGLHSRAVLNYIAVIKAVKKRNRHIQAAVGAAADPQLRAVDLLSQQYFYTSPRLAALATQAELLSQVMLPQSSIPGVPCGRCILTTCSYCLPTDLS